MTDKRENCGKSENKEDAVTEWRQIFAVLIGKYKI